MSRESWREIVRGSNVPLDKSVTEKIFENKISFRDLAKLACPHKTEFWLASSTGDDPRTCKRWLACRNRAPDRALAFVLAEIMRRYR